MPKNTKTLYGIRHRHADWMFCEKKQDRDALWNTIQNYSDVAAEWEICEKQIPIFAVVPRATDASEARAA